MAFKVKTLIEVDVKYIKAEAGVRYWEDAKVNGVDDVEGTLIPFRHGDTWDIVIDLETGTIIGWPKGIDADTCYKVCDDGVYTLLNEQKEPVVKIEGYVPDIMCPEGGGYGDYIEMKIDSDGKIANWKVTLDEFERKAVA